MRGLIDGRQPLNGTSTQPQRQRRAVRTAVEAMAEGVAMIELKDLVVAECDSCDQKATTAIEASPDADSRSASIWLCEKCLAELRMLLLDDQETP